MTAEIALMNQGAVALAADSAATVSETKIVTANKIFALSKYEPIGMMVYGEISLLQVPWETVIKEYRASLGEKSFRKLHEYGDDFLRFVGSNKALFPQAQQELFAFKSATEFLRSIRADAKRQMARTVGGNDATSLIAIKRIVEDQIDGERKGWRKMPNRPQLEPTFRRRLRARYGDLIDLAIQTTFENLPLTKRARENLFGIVLDAWCKENTWGLSGVVIAGFGTDEVFPSVVSYEIDGVVLDTPLVWRQVQATVDHQEKAAILGFAQTQEMQLFVEGVNPDYQSYLEAYFVGALASVDGLLKDAVGDDTIAAKMRKALAKALPGLLGEIASDLSDHREDLFAQPIRSMVAILPKDELAALAESLVHLTSLRRKVSQDQETVGGPIDVAVISRSDGLVWTRRKHYFPPELNHQFFTNYFRSQ